MTTQSRGATLAVAVSCCIGWLGYDNRTHGQAQRPVAEYPQVASVLDKYCVGCHNATDQEGDFSVASLADLRAGTPTGGPVIVPGHPERSRLLDLLTGKQEPHMPPEDEPQPSQTDIDVLREWIAAGAIGDEFSSSKPAWQPPSLPPAEEKYHRVTAACAVDSQRYAVGELGQVRLLASATDSVLWTADGLEGKVNSLRPSMDGKLLVVGGGVAGLRGEALLLDTATGARVQRLIGHEDSIYCAALSPDGHVLATGGYDRRVILWDPASGQIVRELNGHNGAIYDLDFDPTGKLLATASSDQTVKLWHVADGKRLDTFGQPEGEQRCVRFSPDGRYVFAAGSDRQIRQWEIVSRDQPAINPLRIARFAHEADIVQLALGVPAGTPRLISTSTDNTVKVWDLEQLLPLGAIAELSDVPVGVCVTPAWQSRLDQTSSAPPEDTSVTAVRIVELSGRQQLLSRGDWQTKLASAGEARATNAPVAPRLVEDLPAARSVTLPAQLSGRVEESLATGDHHVASQPQDLIRFTARRGEPWIIEVRAAADSPLDSVIDVLDAAGRPVLRTRLQAVRQTYFTFRGKDSDTATDFRLHKWEDMELDEYLYANGEVNRLWLYPRGPDSGFNVYPGTGLRQAFFDTTALAHALGEPAYIVRELPSDETPPPNGLPVFPIFYENDDDASRQLGRDSRLTFSAPADGEYWLRIRDARGFAGEDYRYELAIRRPNPDFSLKIAGIEMSVPLGSGREWSISATRFDGLTSAIEIELSGLPPGLLATNPVIIEAGQKSAVGCVYAPIEFSTEFESLFSHTEQNQSSPHFKVTLTARARDGDREIVRQLEEHLLITITRTKELTLQLVSADGSGHPLTELDVHPGQTISARVVAQRNGLNSRISFGKEDAGRNLPHGAFIDNIGLNGLLITESRSDREFFITAAPKVAPGRRQFHLRAETAGNPTSPPIWLNVLP